MKNRNQFHVVSALVIVAVAMGIIAVTNREETITGRPVLAASVNQTKQAKSAAVKVSPTEVAIRTAAARKRYIFVTFYKKGDAASNKMLAVIKSVQGKLSSKANFAIADVANPIHQRLVKRYGVNSASIPLTLVLAPNGAVTAGFPKEIKSTDFSDVFVSDGLANVLKVLQDGKLAAVCIQGAKTKFNKESLAAAEGLKTDSRLSGNVGVVRIDPTDHRESKFLQQCKINSGSANSQIMIIIPPGRVIGTFDGNTTKDKLMAGLQSAMSSCGSGGCGPSGCGP